MFRVSAAFEYRFIALQPPSNFGGLAANIEPRTLSNSTKAQFVGMNKHCVGDSAWNWEVGAFEVNRPLRKP